MSPNEGQEVYEEANAEVQKNEMDMDTSKYSALESGDHQASSKFLLFLTQK